MNINLIVYIWNIIDFDTKNLLIMINLLSMSVNNDEHSINIENLCVEKMNINSGYELIIKDYDNTRILAILLTGNIIDKINTLKTIEIPTDIKISSIVGIYSGMIDSNVKKLAAKNKIKLLKSLNFNSDIYNISIKSNNKNATKIEFTSCSKRSRLEIEMEILDGIASNDSMPITKIVYMCNLNYKYATDLIATMIKREMLEENEEKNGMKYRITPDGMKYLNNLKKIHIS